ncbi:MAG: LamG-like jellyroll fold domain-containing protein [bacterium]
MIYKRDFHFLIIFLLSLLFLNSCDTANVTAPVKKANLEGYVIDYITYEKMSGAFVKTEPATTVVITDNTGKFVFENIEVKEYVVTAQKNGYFDGNIKIVLDADNTNSVIIPMRDLKSNFGNLHGYLYSNQTKRPIANIDIETIPFNATAKTDDKGYFSIDLPQEKFTLVFKSANYKTYYLNDIQVTGKVTDDYKLYLEPSIPDGNSSLANYEKVYYNFENGYPYDLSGNGNHGSYVGEINYSSGRFGDAVHLTAGSEKYISFITVPFIDYAKLMKYSVVIWAKEENPIVNNKSIYYFFTGDESMGFAGIGRSSLWNDSTDSQKYLCFSTGADKSTIYSPYIHHFTIDYNSWNMYTIVKDGDMMTVYINKDKVATLQQNKAIKPTVHYIGKYINTENLVSTFNNFGGYIDEFRVFNTTLTEEQVANLFYNNSLGK